ncbi:hypothetical protein GCM10008955_39750 [Deinococcus malanensis]|uniref:Bacterial Ig-like domain-containing protein n=1 Tax=Deinococcus malanensis TaxID=1706855 RepID=A0ABQ2F1T8_9DEIO|nr:hypothetical protein GCM10008955_39750 [Deinococcus malanensis]
MSSGTATIGTDTGVLEYSLDSGATWTPMSSATNTYTIFLPAGTVLPGNTVKVRVQALTDTMYEEDETYALTASTQSGMSVSGTATITNTTVPTITVSAPDNTNDTTPTITGTTDASVGSTVTVTITQGTRTITLTTTVQAGGTYSVTVPNTDALVDGPYNVSASVTDLAGNTGTATDPGSVSVAVPDPVLLVDKLVRNVTVSSAFGPAADALPGDVLQYCIRFVNSGGAALAFRLTDVLSPSVTNLINLTYSPSTAPLDGTTSRPVSSALPAGVTLSVINGSIVLDFGNATLPSGSGGTICFEVTLR